MRFQDVLSGKKYDLGHPLDRGTPVWPSHPPFFMTLNNRHGDVPDASNCGYGSANEVIVTSGHHSTHIDALGHISSHGALYGDVAAADVQRGRGQQRGLVSHGVETIEPIVRRGIMLDIPLLKGKSHLEAAEPVTEGDLQAAAGKQDVSVQAGDCVLIRTGWSRFYGDKNVYLAGGGGLPGPDITAAKWLAGKGIFLTGSDTIVYEQMVPDGPGLPVHQELIARCGIHLIECLNLEELAADQVYEFLFVCIPLKITGATGSPVRPVAIV
ncbi:cyclase family protein [Paenibacillus humicola]|uniref:cyclase family protein n=1 Tax=Paenibacillus humicola TaxID=3110540 RepID=UPI00237BB75B|nr:cyclase family protein [Paenibacillus humicola]